MRDPAGFASRPRRTKTAVRRDWQTMWVSVGRTMGTARIRNSGIGKDCCHTDQDRRRRDWHILRATAQPYPNRGGNLVPKLKWWLRAIPQRCGANQVLPDPPSLARRPGLTERSASEARSNKQASRPGGATAYGLRLMRTGNATWSVAGKRPVRLLTR